MSVKMPNQNTHPNTLSISSTSNRRDEGQSDNGVDRQSHHDEVSIMHGAYPDTSGSSSVINKVPLNKGVTTVASSRSNWK